MQTLNFDINHLLRKVRSGHFLIPQFQRDFTWKEAQTKLLIDSIARNYPVGSLLVLGKNDDIPLSSRPVDAHFNSDDIFPLSSDIDNVRNEAYYVLDGQQRLTSIARVFLNAHPSKCYYFDLYEMHHNFEHEDTRWIIGHARGKISESRKKNNRLLRADLVLDQETSDVYISEYIEDSSDFPNLVNNKNEARKAAAVIKGIFERIRKFSIPFVALDNDAPLESVCRVFETINSTGTRLTTFDLAVAKYYPDPDIKNLYDTTLDEFPILKEYEVNGEKILQILSLFYLNKEQKFPEATRSILLTLPPRFIKENWSIASLQLAEAYKWIKSIGAIAKTQPPPGLLVSIAATLMRYPGQLESYNFSLLVKKWYFCSTLATSPSHNNNYKIGDDFRNFCDYLNEGKNITFPKVYFTNQSLIDINRVSDNKYRAIQAIMKQSNNVDIFTGDDLNDDIEDHHIFPYSLYKSGIPKKSLNSIANKILISAATNKSLSDTTPEAYLKKIYDRHANTNKTDIFNDIMSASFIPVTIEQNNIDSSRFNHANFNLFLQQRSELIIQTIKKVVEDAWETPNIDQEPE